MKRLQPGVYDDGDGGLHIVIVELLEAHGVEDTPENRATLTAAAERIFADKGLDVETRP